MGNSRRTEIKTTESVSNVGMTHVSLQPRSFTNPTQSINGSANFNFADTQFLQPKLAEGANSDQYQSISKNKDLLGRQVIQRELMSKKGFEQATGSKNRKLTSELKKFQKMLKPYKNQPDVGKAVYLERLIAEADAYVTKEEEAGENRDLQGLAGIRSLKYSAEQELGLIQKLNVPQKRGLQERDPQASEEYQSIDGQQYRITGRKPNRKIEAVQCFRDPKGKAHYYAIGEVVDFHNAMPVVNHYNEPEDLGDWYPRLTHLNGMNVKPTSGMNGAASLQTEVSQNIENVMQENGVVLDQDAVDVLYTYSASLGAARDVLGCIKGKVRVNDKVTDSQKNIMMDAVLSKHRVIVSAHSRGTIKTDNAVELAYKELCEKYKKRFETKRRKEVEDSCIEKYNSLPEKEQARMTENDAIIRFSPKVTKALVHSEVLRDMDSYIKLIYAGNAVSLPSSKLKVTMFVTKFDHISFLFGTYSNKGAKMRKSQKNSVSGGAGAHSFGNYTKQVGKEAATDRLPPSLRDR
jgi:hypothetical protein